VRSRILTSRFRERVIVNCKSGAVWAGVLYSCDRTALVLRSVSAVGEGENRSDLPMDGEVIVLLSEVDFIQRPS
jgi:small nuclear ribonucleoprotein (snRNP)-like protein